MFWGDGGGGLELQEGVACAESPSPQGGGWGWAWACALWDEVIENFHVPGKVLGSLQEKTLSKKCV